MSQCKDKTDLSTVILSRMNSRGWRLHCSLQLHTTSRHWHHNGKNTKKWEHPKGSQNWLFSQTPYPSSDVNQISFLVLSFRKLKNGGAVGGRNFGLPIDKAHRLYNSLMLPHKPWWRLRMQLQSELIINWNEINSFCTLRKYELNWDKKMRVPTNYFFARSAKIFNNITLLGLVIINFLTCKVNA